MKGLDLAEAYYREYGIPMIKKQFPAYEHRIATGLVGEGSECFGFDDQISMDHDYGPSFCIWLTERDYNMFGGELMKAYENLPGEYRGIPPRVSEAQGKGRVGVHEIGNFYDRFIGSKEVPTRWQDWFFLSEHHLAAVTNGRVFVDPLGQFSDIRKALLCFYPEDIRIKKIADGAFEMAQSGQYNYSRCMRRGEYGSAALAIAEFVKAAISMIFLLNKEYQPFYKWKFRRLKELNILSDTAEDLEFLLNAGITKGSWKNQNLEQFRCALNRSDPKVFIIENICEKIRKELVTQKLTDGSEDFLENHIKYINQRIQNPEIRRIHIEGE